MSQSTVSAPRRQPVPLNGVDTPNLLATINVVKGTPELGRFQFRAQNSWVRGTHSRSRIESFSGAGGEHKHERVFEYDADHPAVLVGADQAPTPVEFLLHALATCLTAGIANIAAARGGYKRIRVAFTISGDAPAEALEAIVDQSRARSAVFDVITKGVPVEIAVAVR